MVPIFVQSVNVDSKLYSLFWSLFQSHTQGSVFFQGLDLGPRSSFYIMSKFLDHEKDTTYSQITCSTNFLYELICCTLQKSGSVFVLSIAY